MSIQLLIPSLGESVSEALLAAWLKNDGDTVGVDEPLAEVESEKATVMLPSPAAGVLKITVAAGTTVKVGDLVGTVATNGAAPAAAAKAAAPAAPAPAEKPVGAGVMPAAARLAKDTGVDTTTVQGTGKGGRVSKEDVARAAAQPPAAPLTPMTPAPSPVVATAPGAERTVPMSPLRRTIAQRLVQAQQTAAILTTFNEVDMSATMALRKKYQDRFVEKYGIKLGFMSFFVKAAVEALKAYPAVNAEIRGTDMIFKDHYDIGVAVGGGKGLVVPVIRRADALGFAQVEKAIADFGKRAQANAIAMDELSGGTFTISNGGVYGSMMSTPILNPPQSGILGLHNIVDRAVVRDGLVVARPMMYLALSYDHRMVDGREAVSFLVRIKELIEDPSRLFLEV